MDTVVSSHGKSKGCLATFVERQKRFYIAIKIENGSATEMYRAISQLYEHFPKTPLKLIPLIEEKSLLVTQK